MIVGHSPTCTSWTTVSQEPTEFLMRLQGFGFAVCVASRERQKNQDAQRAPRRDASIEGLSDVLSAFKSKAPLHRGGVISVRLLARLDVYAEPW